MAYAFRIHACPANNPQGGKPANPSTMAGWTPTSYIAGTFLDNIQVGAYASKMGTSIPSFFSRIDLFNVAFEAKKGAMVQQLRTADVDTKLISECLDMLELLFQHGNDREHLVVKHWNAAQQIANLKASCEEHKELAEVIQSEIKNHQIGGSSVLDDIYLFYWKENIPGQIGTKEILIGGTSPYTLVFTSPNWKREARAMNLCKMRLDGSPMFFDATGTDTFKSLGDRSPQFANMLYAIRMAYPMATQSQAFDKYVNAFWNDLAVKPLEILKMGGAMAAFVQKYPPIRDIDNSIVMAGQLPCCYENIVVTSGYEMKPTASRWSQYQHNNVTINLAGTPLALSPEGLPYVPYINSQTHWNSSLNRIDEAVVRGQKLHDRVLPGNMGIKYPYVIASDFLEDKIIKLPTKLDASHFYTAFNGDSYYLLPLRKTFFKFFNPDDIDKIVKISMDGGDVIVTLNIPIVDTTYHTIPLSHKYSGNNIVALRATNIAFFPFYRVDWPNRQYLNRYNVMARGKNLSLSFIDTATDIDIPLNASDKMRTPEGGPLGGTRHYHIDSAFDIVEFSLTDSGNVLHALIVPKMTRITDAAINAVSYAVDFGTSNTHVAYQSNPDAEPVPFTIDNFSDGQTIMLAAADAVDNNFINREFTPLAIGRDKDVHYPMRTTVCETKGFEGEPTILFGNISIGFNFHLEQNALSNDTYKTNLKWLLEGNNVAAADQNRVQNFFKHTLWLLKNKSLLNGGDDNFNVYLTFPESMILPTRTSIMNAWRNAMTDLGIQCNLNNSKDFSESLAPYNSLAHIVGGESYMNVDIGGGTNDVLFVVKNNGTIQKAFYSSARFAANDLWGNGQKIGAAGGINNGFLDCVNAQIQNSRAQIPQALMRQYDIQLQRSDNADVLSYVFQHSKEFKPNAIIQGQKNLFALLFIHYGAILYNVARLIKKQGIDIPPVMSFTGMGSKYINIITEDIEAQTQLTKLLLELYTGKKVPANFSILSFVNNPNVKGDVKEVTANGAILGQALVPAFKILPNQLKRTIDYGFDTDYAVTFGELTTETMNKVSVEFAQFVDSWTDSTIRNFLNQNFGLLINQQLLNDLKILGVNSLNLMKGLNAFMEPVLELNETLFFWSLKTSIYEVSKKYKLYK